MLLTGEKSDLNTPQKEVRQNSNFLIQMKKLFFFAFVFLFAVSACNQSNEVTPMDNFSKETAQLKTMHKEGLYVAVSAFKKNLTITSSNDLVVNEKGMVSDVLNALKGSYFTASDEFTPSLSNNFGVKNLTVNTQQSVSMLDFNQPYNENQKQLVKPFLNKLLATDDLTQAKNLSIDFQNKVISSSLVREDKIILLSLSASIQALAEFITEGGDEPIREMLKQIRSAESNPIARVEGCSVNWGDVWMGAVLGGLGAAASGCYAGATAGTVTFPLVGTVTGCVGAGMVGLAGGFASGAVYGVASGLLRTCFK
jgi:hypothetical protein